MKNGMDQRGAGLKMKGPLGKASSKKKKKKKDGKNSSYSHCSIFLL